MEAIATGTLSRSGCGERQLWKEPGRAPWEGKAVGYKSQVKRPREKQEGLTPAWWLSAPPCFSGTCSANDLSPLRSPPAPFAAPGPGKTSSASQLPLQRGPTEGGKWAPKLT